MATTLAPMATLDELFGDYERDLDRTYLKLDTQGFDLEVLKGGEQMVSRLPALQTELSFRQIYLDMPDYKTATAAFEKHGFSIADFFLVSTDGSNRALEFDCIMVRDRAL